jgi:hypothetical protein
MDGSWEDDVQRPQTGGQPWTYPPSPPPTAEQPWTYPPAPDISLSLPGNDTPVAAAADGFSGAPAPSARPRSRRNRIVLVGVVLSVVAAFGIVSGINSRESGIRAALASVFSSPSLRVVFTAQTTNPTEQATISQYSVVLSVTSENGHAPLSGSDAADEYEVSVMRGGVDLADVIVADQALYARVNLQAISASAWQSAEQSIANMQLSQADEALARAVLNDQWVGVDDSTLKSIEQSLGSALPTSDSTVNFDNLRNAFTLSFAQSWDAWASIHQVSSSNGTTEYSVKLPVQHFVSTFFNDVKGAVLTDLPVADAPIAHVMVTSLSSAISKIPAGLEIPMTMWVANGSLDRLLITYKGDSLNLAISHPAEGVTVPSGAFMITAAMIKSFLSDALCSSMSASAGAGAPAASCGSSGMTSLPTTSGISGVSGISGSTGVSGASGFSGNSGVSGVSNISTSGGGVVGSSSSNAAVNAAVGT